MADLQHLTPDHSHGGWDPGRELVFAVLGFVLLIAVMFYFYCWASQKDCRVEKCEYVMYKGSDSSEYHISRKDQTVHNPVWCRTK